MLYLIYQHLDPHGHYITAINLMRYLTFRTGMALFTAQIVVALMGNRFIDWMRVKQGRGQPIRKDGIERHIIEKAGTPTMGGFMILAGVLIGTLLWADLMIRKVAIPATTNWTSSLTLPETPAVVCLVTLS